MNFTQFLNYFLAKKTPKNIMKFILGLFFLIVAFKYSFAIKCYVCNSVDDKNCLEEGFDTSKYTPDDCSKKITSYNVTSCLKIISTCKFNWNLIFGFKNFTNSTLR